MSGDQLFALQRRERIMDEIREHGSVTVSAIAVRLGVSELTIRRDINSLAQQGLVTRETRVNTTSLMSAPASRSAMCMFSRHLWVWPRMSPTAAMDPSALSGQAPAR